MTETYQDRYYLNLILMVLFILGIGASVYYIYSLPLSLRLEAGYQTEFMPVYIVTVGTFVIGLMALVWALRYKKEILVFRDKIIDVAELKKEEAQQAGRTTINLEGIRSTLVSTNLKESLSGSLQGVCKQLDAAQGALYLSKEHDGKRLVELAAGYALNRGESSTVTFEYGEGLVGQVASTGHTILIDEVPEGYITVISGLGSSSPRYILIAALKNKDHVLGVMEIASFTKASDDQKRFVEEAAQLIAEKISMNA